MRCRIHCIPNHPRHSHIPDCLLHLDSNSMGLVCLLPPDLSHPLSIHSHNLPPLITGVCTMRHKHVHSPQHRVESPSRRGRRGIRTPSSQLYTLRTPSSPLYTLLPTGGHILDKHGVGGDTRKRTPLFISYRRLISVVYTCTL